MSNSQSDLERSIASQLGRMIMRFAALEMITRHTLRQVLEDLDEEEVLALTSELSFRKVRAVLIAVFAKRHPSSTYLETLKGLMARARKLEERRNALVHSAWIYTDLPDFMAREKVKVTDRGVYKADLERFKDITELQGFVDEIDELTDELAFSWIDGHLGVRQVREQED